MYWSFSACRASALDSRFIMSATSRCAPILSVELNFFLLGL